MLNSKLRVLLSSIRVRIMIGTQRKGTHGFVFNSRTGHTQVEFVILLEAGVD